jgi:hypothetical protein
LSRSLRIGQNDGNTKIQENRISSGKKIVSANLDCKKRPLYQGTLDDGGSMPPATPFVLNQKSNHVGQIGPGQYQLMPITWHDVKTYWYHKTTTGIAKHLGTKTNEHIKKKNTPIHSC